MEPYVMVRRTEQMPLLNEIFINYGFNKVEWIENLRYLGICYKLSFLIRFRFQYKYMFIY